MLRTIVGFRQDEEGHWIAELACGHGQHVRHRPPFVERPWAATVEGRRAKLGVELECRQCSDAADSLDPDAPGAIRPRAP